MSAASDRTLDRRLVIVAAVAGLACLFWLERDRAAFFQAYLVAWLFVVALSAGSAVNLMIHDLTGGRWGAVLRPGLEAAAGAMPLAALLALPLALGLPDLYPWARPGAGGDALIAAKRWYLNEPFFLARAAVILACWSALALALRRDWRARRTTVAPRPERYLSILGLLVYFVTVSVAAVDWIASLVPAWYSSTIGLRVGVAQATAAFAFSIPAAAWLVPASGRGEGTARDRQDLGNLLLMFVMLWAYLAFTEFLIIWAEDLPHETAWYLPRAQTSWHALAIVLVVVEFALPAFAMLFRAVKCTTAGLTVIALVVLAGQWLDTVWLVLPSLRPDGLRIRPVDLLATIALAAIFLATARRLIEQPGPLPVPDAPRSAHG